MDYAGYSILNTKVIDEKFWVDFIVNGRYKDRIIDFKQITEQIAIVKIRGNCFDINLVNVPSEDKYSSKNK